MSAALCNLSARPVGRRNVPFKCSAHKAPADNPNFGQQHIAIVNGLGRRAALLATAALLAGGSMPSIANAAQPATVGSYLPPAGIDDLVLFVPDARKTPAIRAGTIDASNPYKFGLPPSWRERAVANIQSGNYCQPRCAEPWTEVIFSDDEQGKAAIIVAPLVRLTNKPEAKIEDVGTPEGVLESLGPFITGTYLDQEDVVNISTKQIDGRTYYVYEINASYGTNGPHTLTAATTKGELAVMLVVSATDKQWARSEKKLRTVLDTFRA